WGPRRWAESGGRGLRCAGDARGWGARRWRCACCGGGAVRPSRRRDPSRGRGARGAGTVRPLAAPVLRGGAHGEALAPLLAPTREHGAAPHGLHARSETMLLNAPRVARTIRRTHGDLS